MAASTTVENMGDDKSDDKYFCHARKRLKTLTFLRFYRKTLTPYVRVRILLPLPDIALNCCDSRRFSLFFAAFPTKKLSLYFSDPYFDPY